MEFVSRVPNHLARVQDGHLNNLKGYSLRYKALGDGACLARCIAVHIHEDNNEGPNLKRRITIWLTMTKIGLPYIETVGVG